jgi:hypothetical protein
MEADEIAAAVDHAEHEVELLSYRHPFEPVTDFFS